MTPGQESEMTHGRAAGASTSRRNVLIVEDELMIRMLLEDMLTELGYEIAAAAAQVEDAVRLAEVAEIDVAILDVNLNGHTVSPVAEVLDARGLPFVFATGYGERGLPERYRDRPTVQKPFEQHALRRALDRVFPAETA
jgi:CheY-like chemotaxis protein